MHSSTKTGVILMIVSGVLFVIAFFMDLIFSFSSGHLNSLFSSLCCMVSPFIFIAGFILMMIGLVQKDPAISANWPPRTSPPELPTRPPHAPAGPDPSLLQMALNYEKAERWGEAAGIYQKLGLLEEAVRCRRKQREVMSGMTG